MSTFYYVKSPDSDVPVSCIERPPAVLVYTYNVLILSENKRACSIIILYLWLESDFVCNICGNKVNWCGDITSENIDRICTIEDYQVQCCDTCKDYIGLTTTSTISSSTATTTTTVAPTTSTRLPPVSDK